MAITINDQQDIEKMRIAGKLAAEVLDYIAPFVKAGITTEAIDKLCHDYMVDVQHTIPAPLNYAPPGHTPYPKSICTSVNHQICHGVPSDKVLKNGDILNIDITVIKDGYHGDTSRMFYVGEPSIQAKRLCEITYQAMWLGNIKSSQVILWEISALQFSNMRTIMALALLRSSAVMVLARNFTKTHRYCTMVTPKLA
jgi:methionyl aminopeptidase